MRKLLLAAVAALALAAAAPALAADPTTSGSATITDGVGTIVSNTAVANTPADDGGSITFPIASGLTLAQITQLSAEFNVTDDDCSAGSPRFVINFGTNKNVVVYLDPTSSVSGGCTANTWLSTGNLVGVSDACHVDTSQISPGTQCTATWASAVTLMGSQPILSISLVVDSGWSQADLEQTVQFRNVKINSDTFLTPEAPKPPKVNPTTACKAELALVGRTAFNEHWAKDGTSNGFGKCVSTAAHAQNLSAMHSQIMNAAKTCKAKGLKGEKLGQCIAATDHVAATLTEAQENKGKAKGRP
jgi:hypothetical protein